MAKKKKVGSNPKLETKEEIKKKYSSTGNKNKTVRYLHSTNALRKQIKNSKDPEVVEIRNTYKKFKSDQETRMKEAEKKPVTRVVKKNK